MNETLVVVRSFADHTPGDIIDNPAAVAAVRSGENANCVVRLADTHRLSKSGREE